VPLFLRLALGLASAGADLQEIENQYRAAYESNVGAKHVIAVAEMDEKYASALDRAMNEATQAGRLEDAIAYKGEIQRIKDKGPSPQTTMESRPLWRSSGALTGSN